MEGLYHGLKPFWVTTLRLEGHGKNGSYGVIWEVLPGLEMLLSHTEKKITELIPEQQEISQLRTRSRARQQYSQTPSQTAINPLLVCYQSAWEVLLKYNNLTDKSHEIYAAAALLNPCMRKRYFQGAWTEDAAAFIEPMIQKNRGIWETIYGGNTPTEISSVPSSELSQYILNICATDAAVGQHQDDDFERYINGHVTTWTEWKTSNLFTWWLSCPYPSLRQWALDTLSIPATSTELERTFSQAKRFLTDDRNRLLATSFEALQCLKQWATQGVYNVADPQRFNILPTNREAQ